MKKNIIILSSIALFLLSCKDSTSTKEDKKAELKELKSQLLTVKSKISKLEKDTTVNNLSTEKRVPIRVKQLEPELFTHQIEQPGKINSKENVLVSIELGGTVTSLNTKEGEWVMEGQTILQLDTTIMRSSLNELKSALELAKTTYERQEKLWQKGIGSELQFLQLKNQYESLKNKFLAQEAQFEKLNVKAPITGFIEDIFLNKGELAAPGIPAFRIVNTKNVYIEADVAERYSTVLKKNSPVKVHFRSLGITKIAPISFVGQVINPENSTFKVKIELDNDADLLKPNGLASLEIQDYVNDEAIIVPSQIVKKDMMGDYIFMEKNGKAVKTYVKLGLSQEDKSMILSGLEFGDKVIVEGYSEVINGTPVDVLK